MYRYLIFKNVDTWKICSVPYYPFSLLKTRERQIHFTVVYIESGMLLGPLSRFHVYLAVIAWFFFFWFFFFFFLCATFVPVTNGAHHWAVRNLIASYTLLYWVVSINISKSKISDNCFSLAMCYKQFICSPILNLYK